MKSNIYLNFNLDTKDIEPFYSFILEDKSKYKKASEVINPKTNRAYHDPDGDWLVDNNGAFLPNISFVFKKVYRLRESALFYKKHKVYTFLDPDNNRIEYNNFRKREEHRRKHGYTANCKLLHSDINLYEKYVEQGREDEADNLLKPLRVSGEHYNFINYGRIILLDEHKVVEGTLGAEKGEDIPLFIDSQYWFTKAKEFAKSNGYHILILKSRRKGMSYLEGVDSANETNLNPKVTVIHGAYLKDYITKGNSLSPMAKTQLEFYEEHTPFNRNFRGEGLLKKDINELRIGYKTSARTDSGYLSRILALGFKDSVDKAIGKDGKKIKFDEMGNFPNFEEVMDVTEPTTRTGAYLTGFIFCGGTGGSKEGSWVQFERNYKNPGMFNFMPFGNIWDYNARHKKIGYFMPFWFGLQGTIDGERAMDEDGNSIYTIAMKVSTNERLLKELEVGGTSSTRYIKHCSQYPNRPAEAFSNSVTNIFSGAILSKHIERLEAATDLYYKDGNFIKENGVYKFKTLDQLEQLAETNIQYKDLVHSYIESFPMNMDADPHGCFRIYHSPYRDKNGEVPDDLYEACYDTVGKDLDSPEVKLFHSLNSFFILTRPNDYGIPQDMIVAGYAGRPMLMKTADRYAFNACSAYNAKVMVEVDRGNTVSNFRSWGGLRYLLHDPMYVIKGKEEPMNIGYGINIGGTSDKAEDGLKWTKEFFYTYHSVREDGSPIYVLETIEDLPLLQEAAKYSAGLNVDRLSALRAYMFRRKVISLQKQAEDTTNVNNDIYDTITDAMCLN